MALKYKIGDLVVTDGMSDNYLSCQDAIPNGTVVRIKRFFGNEGYYIDDPRSRGWWMEMNLLPLGGSQKKRTGFAKFIRKVEDGKH